MMESWKRLRSYIRPFLNLALVLLIPLSFPVHTEAARRLSVDEFGRTLAANQAANLPDSECAQRIASLELSERPDASTVMQWLTLSCGPKTTEIITSVANLAIFLDPPASSIPSTPPPDIATQRKIVSQAINFVTQTLYRLPDFLADRVTTNYADTPQSFSPGAWPVRLGAHAIGHSSAEIAFRDGRETDDPASTQKPEARGLTSWGEFGPILSVVFTDASKGTLAWKRWELQGASQVAVFQFAVARAQSHYFADYCCVEIPGEPLRGNIRRAPTEIRFHQAVGYRGTLTVDPVTGNIVRLVIQADLETGAPLRRADIAVEYRKVSIGENEFTCPLRSISIAVVPETSTTTANDWPGAAGGCLTCQHVSRGTVVTETNSTRLLLNEVEFQNYHKFGSTARIVPPQVPASGSAQDSVSSQPAAREPGSQQMAAPPAPSLESTPVPSSASDFMPAQQVTQTALTDHVPSLKVTSRLVSIGLFASDKKGHPLLDLTANDLEIYDEGRKQEIRFFTPPLSTSSTLPTSSASQPLAYLNHADQTQTKTSTPAAVSKAILLIDEAHVAWADLSSIRQQILRFLNALHPGDQVGLYTTPGNSVRVLVEPTDDSAALVSALQKWAPSAQSIARAQEEERRNRQLFDEVGHPADLAAVNGNPTDEQTLLTATDPELRTMGDSASRDSLILLTAVARHLAAIPGRKSLVWISSDNVFANWQDRAIGVERGPDSIESPSRHALEALNNAQVSVFPLDASQLEGGAITADIQHRNVELTQPAADVAALGGGITGREIIPGRNIEQLHQDTLAIQDSIRRVAEDTGGRTIRRAGDQASNLASIVDRAVFFTSSASPLMEPPTTNTTTSPLKPPPNMASFSVIAPGTIPLRNQRLAGSAFSKPYGNRPT